ncbi:hypothetical protein BE21_03120 [Sorangium cellulosum]|uniref:ABC transporter substrate-binding protein n=1 Tax=Sorangium cellulosum TaxID=56 RepID=A0A150TPM4_SORCE|nr:hypothetical protein BE21_03120 [Sorangium cellulosum]
MSSYTLDPVDALRAPTVVGLIDGLSRCGRKQGRDYGLVAVHSNALEDLEAALQRWLRDGVDLLFSGGTPACAVIRKVLADSGQHKPVVYYGAHPIDGKHEVALEDCLRPDTVCVRIELPLTYTPRNFSILRRLFPELRKVHIPFARNTAFCHREMAERYDRFVAAHGPHGWLQGDEVGFASLRDLSWIIDADYAEHPLRSAAGLREALRAIPARSPAEPVHHVIVAFNDTYHVAGAPRVLLDRSRQSNVPVVWVNNPTMPPAGAVADFCNPFMRVAQHAARYVEEFLAGRWEEGRQTLEWSHDTHFSMNRARLIELGVPGKNIEGAARFFHEILG